MKKEHEDLVSTLHTDHQEALDELSQEQSDKDQEMRKLEMVVEELQKKVETAQQEQASRHNEQVGKLQKEHARVISTMKSDHQKNIVMQLTRSLNGAMRRFQGLTRVVTMLLVSYQRSTSRNSRPLVLMQKHTRKRWRLC